MSRREQFSWQLARNYNHTNYLYIMSISSVFFNFWRKASMPILVAALMLCYFNLPDNAAIHHNSSGDPDVYIDKQDFFYIALAVIIIFNFLLNLLRTSVQKVDFVKLNPASIWANNAKNLNELLESWFNAFIAVANTYLAFVLLGLKRVNATLGQKLDFNYNWLLLAGLVLLMVLLFFLPIRLLFSNPSEK